MFCRKCGQELNEEMQFCIKCGNAIRSMPIEAEDLPEDTHKITKKEFLKNCSPKVKSWIKTSWILYFISIGLTVALILMITPLVFSINKAAKESGFYDIEVESEGETYGSSSNEDFETFMNENKVFIFIIIFSRSASLVISIILGAVTCKTKSIGSAVFYCICAFIGCEIFLPFAIPILVFMCKINKEYKFFANTRRYK